MEPDIDPTTQPAPPINPMASIDQMAQAAGGMPPPQTAPVDQPTGPESTAPPWDGMADPNTIEASAAAVHHSRLAQTLHNVIDAVGNVLGGPQTVHVTKQQDGSVQVTHDPSTTGEKWGRVAQAALGGLAQGFAAGPGPGGIGRAGAGGISAGMAMPQQREDQANQAAQQQNTALYQKQTADANKAIHQQEIAKNTMQLADMGEKYSQGQVDRANENADWILSNPSNKHVGTMGSMKDVLEFERTHEDMMHNMTHGGYHVEATNEDGKPVFKLYTFDQALADQKNDKPVTYKVLDTGDDGKLAIKDYTVPTGAMTNGAIASAHEASTKAITAWELANAKERQAEQPKTPAELAYDAQNNPDPAKRAASTAALSAVQNTPAIQAEIEAHHAAAVASRAQAGLATARAGKLQEDEGEGTKGEALVDSIASGHITIDRLGYLAARNPDLLAAVTKKDPTFDSSKAASYPAVYKDFMSTKKGATGAALNSGATALKHMQELDALNTVASHIPGTPAYNAYMNKADTVATELGAFYGTTTIPAIAAIKDTLTKTAPGNRHVAITTQAGSMGDKLDSYEQSWRNAAPSRSYEAPMPQIDDKAKEARAALDPAYHARLVQEQQGGAQPQAGTGDVSQAARAPAATPYPILGDGKGKYIQWDGTKYANVPAPAGAK